MYFLDIVYSVFVLLVAPESPVDLERQYVAEARNTSGATCLATYAISWRSGAAGGAVSGFTLSWRRLPSFPVHVNWQPHAGLTQLGAVRHTSTAC